MFGILFLHTRQHFQPTAKCGLCQLNLRCNIFDVIIMITMVFYFCPFISQSCGKECKNNSVWGPLLSYSLRGRKLPSVLGEQREFTFTVQNDSLKEKVSLAGKNEYWKTILRMNCKVMALPFGQPLSKRKENPRKGKKCPLLGCVY